MLATAAPRAPRRADPPGHPPRVCVACPDARPPGYEAAAGLERAGSLQTFLTAAYHTPDSGLGRWLAACPGTARVRTRLARRDHPGIPAARVIAHPWVDAALLLENRAGQPAARRAIARFRTDRFDRTVARYLASHRPDVAMFFSDVGSVHALDRARALGIPVVLSVVHGEIDEERTLLERQRTDAPDYFPLYLGDGRLDERELAWLHERRRREAERADLLLVPSDHIARRLVDRGIPDERVRVVPYAADLERFRPRPRAAEPGSCTFVFAGGITQRKGISYLLDAWGRVRRDGWRLRLVGPLPDRMGPLADRLTTPGIEWVGRVGHADMPAALSDADAFVFPSLFEGSAVVTYEALACGLPSIVTAESGAVVRDGVEGLVVPAADADALARALARVGTDPALRARLAAAARLRAEAFPWSRYHDDVARAAADVAAR